jgi:adenylate cyclase
VALSPDDVSARAGVDADYVRRLARLGALEGRDDEYTEGDVQRVAIISAWEAAGLSAESIVDAVAQGELSFAFLETPGWTLPERPQQTYRELSEANGLSVEFVLAFHQAMGFQTPEPDDRVRNDDLAMVALARIILEIGGPEPVVLRLFRIYADNLRRLATAEADLYREEVDTRLREEGLTEADLMSFGSQVGQRTVPLVRQTLLDLYERQRQHVWREVSVSHVEAALEGAGLYQRLDRPPAICFVDLTGYTRLTEELGDEAAAGLAMRLAALVDDITRRHEGTAIRWLGDGGMFFFKEPANGMVAALEMVRDAPDAGVPPMHIGLQAGAVVFQDGDVFGRTVNIASRLATRAQAGEILTSEETTQLVDDPRVRFVRVGPARLKGIATPVVLYRVRGAGAVSSSSEPR